MTHRTRTMAVLHYAPYDRLPIVHFGFWHETLEKWAAEGHITQEEATSWADGNVVDSNLSVKLGFDANWYNTFSPPMRLYPNFSPRVVKEFPDSSRHVLNGYGVTIKEVPGVTSISPEIAHMLVDRASWEEHYKWRLQWSDNRLAEAVVRCNDKMVPFNDGGCAFLRADERDYPYGLHCGSLYGHIRDLLGVVGLSYLMVDDAPLFDEIIDTVGELVFQGVKCILASGAKFDFAHFWEDICFKNGPLIRPETFAAKVGPHYRRITDLLHRHGIDIITVDCDGWIDSLIPTWIENGVNTMFPIEVGTWDASIKPWREKYGQELRGVGGMNKVAFSRDRSAIDAEIERLKPLVEMGGYIPCPDHRIAPDAKWDNVRYYCEHMRETFS